MRWRVPAAAAALGAGLAGAWLAGWIGGASPDRFRSVTGPVPASEQRPGDPEAGYRALVNAPYVGCGIPWDAWRQVAPATDPADLLPGREGRNAELPYALTSAVTPEGVEIVASNCLTCHAARIGDELIVGLGNEFLDFTGDARTMVTQSGAYVRGAAETAAWQHWADRIEAIAPYIRTQVVGPNPATNLTWALMAHRDPRTLEWSDTPRIEPPPETPLPVSVPPLWRMSKKNAMFYTTLGRGDHARFMLLAAMLCAETPEQVAEVDAYAPDIRAYIASLTPPAFPWPVDAALAARGRTVFEATCSRCHGTYGPGGTYPDLVVPLDTVGTDPAYALAATDGSEDRFYAWAERSPYGPSVRTAPARGYSAPPLDGVWATAPYLHNGSVPDMVGLLDSSRRPAFWRHRTEPRAYDPATLGWRHEVLDHGQDGEPDPALRRTIYDTTLHGHGNGGHTFGDRLSPEDRQALIEYLKTL